MLLTYCWVQSGIPRHALWRERNRGVSGRRAPTRHGIGTNIYTPMVRPLNGLFEQIAAAGGVSAMYYGWEPLRDAARPGSLRFAGCLNVNPAPGWEGKSPAESVFPSKISFCTLRRLHGFPGRYFCHNSMNTFHFPVGDGDISRKFLSYSAE